MVSDNLLSMIPIAKTFSRRKLIDTARRMKIDWSVFTSRTARMRLSSFRMKPNLKTICYITEKRNFSILSSV